MINTNKLAFKNSDGKPCVTTTAFIIGAIIVNLKLLLSSLTVAGVAFGAFTGSEYALCMGSLGAVYVLRRGQQTKDE